VPSQIKLDKSLVVNRITNYTGFSVNLGPSLFY